MFNRPGKSDTSLGDAVRRTAPRVASLITQDLTIEGNLTGGGELQIDCVVRGDVSVSHLSVGETGRIEGAVTAEVVELRGRIIGSITAKQVRLYATAHLEGDLTHEQLTIEPGASFEGRSQKLQRSVGALPSPGA